MEAHQKPGQLPVCRGALLWHSTDEKKLRKQTQIWTICCSCPLTRCLPFIASILIRTSPSKMNNQIETWLGLVLDKARKSCNKGKWKIYREAQHAQRRSKMSKRISVKSKKVLSLEEKKPLQTPSIQKKDKLTKGAKTWAGNGQKK